MGKNNNRGHSPRYRKYKVNEDYFSVIDTSTKAYCLGLLFSDGNVSRDRSRIKLFVNDSELVFILKLALQAEHPILFNKGVAGISINSYKLKQDLIRLGCIPNKSLVVKYPIIDESLDRDFIRGLVDGDGHFGVRQEKSISSNGTAHAYKRLRFHFCGSEDVVKTVSVKLSKIVGEVLTVHKRINNYYIETAGSKAVAIHNYLYKGSVLHLTRKAECGRIITFPL